MCLGGRLRCPDCPQNRWWYERNGRKVPNIHAQEWPVPLIGAHGRVRIVDSCAEVTIEQRFENKEQQPLEVQYEFGLDHDRAAVTKFEALIDNQKVIGELKEKEEARNTYDDAIASGHGAYMLEQDEKSKKFTASIGNLPPGKEVLITIVYVLELEFNDAGQLRLMLAEQGYAPNGPDSARFPAPSTSEANLYKDKVPSGLTIDIELDMTSEISQLICESHASLGVKTEINAANPHRGKVTLPTSQVPLVNNFELLIQLQDPETLVTRLQKNARGEFLAMCSFFPRLDTVEPLGEIIFLVDRSGSMMGPKMTRTKDTMQIFLRSLSAGVIFNIIGFGSSFSMLFPESSPYNDQTLATASAHVKSMGANMGGTEILNPLKAIFKKPANPKYPRQIFILTDGEVANPEDCIRECRASADSTRIFCFGIGSGASKDLVQGMAQAANGDFEMIGNNDRIDDKVLKQLGQALLPAISDIKIDWAGAASRVVPSRQTPVFQGGRVVSYAWINSDAISSNTIPVAFHAVTPVTELNLKQEISTKMPSDGDFLFAIAAKRLLREFETGASYAHLPNGSLAQGWTEQKIKEEMVKISLSTGVICKHTAFVAVEERTDPTQGNMVLRKVIQSSGNRRAAPDARWGKALDDSGSASSGSDEEDLASSLLRGPGGARGGRGGRGGAARSGVGGRPAFALGSAAYAGDDRSVELKKKGKVMKKDTKAVQSRSRSIADYGEREEENAREESPASRASLELLSKPSASSSSRKSLVSAPASSSAAAPFVAEGAPPPAAPVTTEADLTRMREIILKQSASGSWTLEDAASATKSNVAALEAALPLGVDTKDALIKSIFATAVICALLEARFANEKITWQLVVKKARTWINAQPAAAKSAADWASVAKAFIAKI